jgi:hypothetical protein
MARLKTKAIALAVLRYMKISNQFEVPKKKKNGFL